MQAYTDNSLSKLRAKIGSLKTDFNSCIKELKCDIDGLGERVHDMEQNPDLGTEDLEALYRRVPTLEGPQIDLQQKHEHMENKSRRNNICICGIPKGLEG
ncbi:hypothetical protein NDU88_002086 [Pleurodeles waltl]|uniref:Uncharacterized protein n=1 Tax=Pleurodeles waltl TaxID=8319 RepID=A0AAV7M0H8_PLEWA|nr:hypothetical protein NDU88_002086 [Pleurodeles waltl]